DIRSYIADYLLSHGKVFFPGLGTLKITQKGAGVRGGKFSPPSASLKFTSEDIPEEDNHFPGLIAEKERCSLEDARQAILEYIDEIRFAFNKGEAFTMEGICRFFIDEDNNIEVMKDPGFIIDPENYGLESFEMEGFEEMKTKGETKLHEASGAKETQKEKIELVLDVEHDMRKFEETYVSPVRKEPAVNHIEKRESVKRPEVPEYPFYEIPDQHRRNRKLLIGAITSAFIVVIAIVIISQVSDSWNKRINRNEIFRSSQDLEVDDDFSNLKDEDFDFDGMLDEMQKESGTSPALEGVGPVEQPESSESGAESLPAPGESYIEYHIIAGSFSSYENARELQQQLTLLGYPSLVIEPRTGIYRVSAISFRDKVTALNELVKFREKTGMESSWLMNLE
ncbi:MAG: SPOR domain-containing protein, partial [Bacteroidales bacterium]|nr:SPOR domain-containing protein [Bacteroidales bacterium]